MSIRWLRYALPPILVAALVPPVYRAAGAWLAPRLSNADVGGPFIAAMVLGPVLILSTGIATAIGARLGDLRPVWLAGLLGVLLTFLVGGLLRFVFHAVGDGPLYILLNGHDDAMSALLWSSPAIAAFLAGLFVEPVGRRFLIGT